MTTEGATPQPPSPIPYLIRMYTCACAPPCLPASKCRSKPCITPCTLIDVGARTEASAGCSGYLPVENLNSAIEASPDGDVFSSTVLMVYVCFRPKLRENNMLRVNTNTLFSLGSGRKKRRPSQRRTKRRRHRGRPRPRCSDFPPRCT